MEPFFEKVVTGSFVRLGIGVNKQGENVYRVCEVVGVDDRDPSKQVPESDTVSLAAPESDAASLAGVCLALSLLPLRIGELHSSDRVPLVGCPLCAVCSTSWTIA